MLEDVQVDRIPFLKEDGEQGAFGVGKEFNLLAFSCTRAPGGRSARNSICELSYSKWSMNCIVPCKGDSEKCVLEPYTTFPVNRLLFFLFVSFVGRGIISDPGFRIGRLRPTPPRFVPGIELY